MKILYSMVIKGQESWGRKSAFASWQPRGASKLIVKVSKSRQLVKSRQSRRTRPSMLCWHFRLKIGPLPKEPPPKKARLDGLHNGGSLCQGIRNHRGETPLPLWLGSQKSGSGPGGSVCPIICSDLPPLFQFVGSLALPNFAQELGSPVSLTGRAPDCPAEQKPFPQAATAGGTAGKLQA